jgi:hypothetical protein
MAPSLIPLKVSKRFLSGHSSFFYETCSFSAAGSSLGAAGGPSPPTLVFPPFHLAAPSGRFSISRGSIESFRYERSILSVPGQHVLIFYEVFCSYQQNIEVQDLQFVR